VNVKALFADKKNVLQNLRFMLFYNWRDEGEIENLTPNQ